MTSTLGDPILETVEAILDERRCREESEYLADSFCAFIREAWHVLKPDEEFKDNWHIDAICEHLMAVSEGQIRHLQIWIPPGMMKSLNVSVFWPAWEWTTRPWLRYWTAVYELGLAGRLAGLSKNVIQSSWYQARWGHQFRIIKDGEKYFSNNKGGTRLATAPGSTGLGEHGHRIIIDDPINAQDADATSRVTLDATNAWYDGTVQSRKANPTTAAEVIIMQRLHENDLAGHAYARNPAAWTILCLPERYERTHPFAWRGDPRSKEGELLWPTYRDDEISQALANSLGPYRRAGQLQQRPSAREGDLLKRYWWRFYDPALFTDAKNEKRRPRFSMVIQSIDTPLKDKQQNDMIAIQAWGVHGADRYLIDLKKGHMSKAQANRAITEQARYVRRMFPRASHFVLIENAGYGVELIQELKQTIGHVKKLSRAKEGDKELRAEAAAASLESGNCWLPGFRDGINEMSMPDDTRNSAEITDFIDSCAGFPNARFDDDVDAWSQCMNWLSGRVIKRARVASSFRS